MFVVFSDIACFIDIRLIDLTWMTALIDYDIQRIEKKTNLKLVATMYM